MKTLTGPRRSLLAHHAHLKIKRFPRKNTRARTSLARPESQCLSFECTQFPLQTTSVVHSSASVSSVRGVLLLSSALSEAVQSLLWQSSKVKYDGERAELVLCWTRIWQRGELTMNWYESLAAQCFFFSPFLFSNKQRGYNFFLHWSSKVGTRFVRWCVTSVFGLITVCKQRRAQIGNLTGQVISTEMRFLTIKMVKFDCFCQIAVNFTEPHKEL